MSHRDIRPMLLCRISSSCMMKIFNNRVENTKYDAKHELQLCLVYCIMYIPCRIEFCNTQSHPYASPEINFFTIRHRQRHLAEPNLLPILNRHSLILLQVLYQRPNFVSCDPVVPGAATRRDPTHQIKLLR